MRKAWLSFYDAVQVIIDRELGKRGANMKPIEIVKMVGERFDESRLLDPLGMGRRRRKPNRHDAPIGLAVLLDSAILHDTSIF